MSKTPNNGNKFWKAIVILKIGNSQINLFLKYGVQKLSVTFSVLE